ncbi:glycosyltransferase, putative [Geotalea daltonii FRC-32]|uniref:Glycosyltransferase, putative n=1 Tax=Geotalea daltonii (strain DSM 22248 / JCM 15807 / FRC-32) TaxID=316067 RepID=B9M577_GEODF|nr:glycosyltransferase family 10 [Geotalea daltonii]ACM19832.1 glycosyltransferase, putative [Geotalea daltonii FRC-32]
MLRIKLTTASPEWPLLRQTPLARGIWGECQFILNQEVDECDFWVVCEGLLEPEKTVCPPENLILITAEPPPVKRYSQRFVDQFSTVVTCHRKLKHSHVIHSQQALPWMVGGNYSRESKRWESFSKDYDELSNLGEYKKERLLAVILARKTFTSGHRKRLAFVERLKSHFGDQLDIYGVGIREIADKWDGIAPYKYYLAIENCSYEDYWTEKLSDAYLAGAYPFYYGCPNIEDYFPIDAFTRIDPDNMDSSIAIIEKQIEHGRYEQSINAIQSCRDLVLNKYNLFPMVAELCRKQYMEQGIKQKSTVNLQPEPNSYLRRKVNKIRNILNL